MTKQQLSSNLVGLMTAEDPQLANSPSASFFFLAFLYIFYFYTLKKLF